VPVADGVGGDGEPLDPPAGRTPPGGAAGADPRDHPADPPAGIADGDHPHRRPAARLGVLLVVAGALAVLLTAGVVAALTGLAALVPDGPPVDPRVTTSAGALADHVPAGDARRTSRDGAPGHGIAVAHVDPDGDAAPAELMAASDRGAAAAVRIEGHGVPTRAIRGPVGRLPDPPAREPCS